ncbi:Pi dikinase regulatory protein 1) (PPDK RP1) (PPDK regulatory protein 1) [Durusdinium trenchii]|uniref:Pi dikinase regulatory protein 1 (PPDK RP1 (PPDK regulatory protein 1 n=1 Tax=Durusdinium trenchii TaxID=1381693 RepID=A0ABP0QIF5_9DINO
MHLVKADVGALTDEDISLLRQVLPEVKELVVLGRSNTDVILQLAETMLPLTLAKGEVLAEQGQPDDNMYVIAKGDVLLDVPRAGRVEPERRDGDTCAASQLVNIFVLSDSTGESAKASVKTAAAQFEYCSGSTCATSRATVYRFVRSATEIKTIVEAAKKCNALLVYTIMDPKLHQVVVDECKAKELECIDLWGPLLATFEKRFGAKRSGKAGRRQAVSDDYMTIVKAIEYTRKVDDGVLPHLWDECDIMLIGPSRAGKTPLSFYLAQRGYKADVLIFGGRHVALLHYAVGKPRKCSEVQTALVTLKDDLNDYSILQSVLADEKKALVHECASVEVLDKAMGALCGMAVGDALGHPFEYITVTDDTGTSHFDLSTLEFHGEFNKFACQRGQWTDDASMGLCMADSFILRRGFDGSDMRKRFWCWWFRGYNNAFRKDTARSSKKSIGLGGNTQKSLEPLDAFADGGDVPPVYDSASEDAGNGSLMRPGDAWGYYTVLPGVPR